MADAESYDIYPPPHRAEPYNSFEYAPIDQWGIRVLDHAERGRIRAWSEDVSQENRCLKSKYGLRAQPAKRKALADITNNPRRQRVKMSNISPAKKPRGRPRKVKQDIFDGKPDLGPSDAADNRPLSPSKIPPAINNKTNAQIDMAFLAKCQPPVFQFSYAKAKDIVPKQVEKLWEHIQGDLEYEQGFIPNEVKPFYDVKQDTPTKYQYRDLLFMKSCPYPTHRLQSLLDNVEAVSIAAQDNEIEGAYEREWGASVVSQLLHRLSEFRVGQAWKVKNAEDCRMGPREVLMKRPNNKNLLVDEASGITFGDLVGDDTTEKRIDWACGLCLTASDEMILQTQIYAGKATGFHSLNQTDDSSPIASYPLFLSIEVKRPQTTRDPCVQLAIWEAAGFIKKGLMGWDTSMPVPGITVDGHFWKVYFFFKNAGGAIIMLGPQLLGNTLNVRATWELVFKLHKLVKWGQTNYAHWFHTKVLRKASWTPPAPAPPIALG